MRNWIAITVILLHTPAGLSGVANATERDKSGFHLFNPVPRELMRDLAPDRPDTTESAYTVDAGHVQIESSVVDFVRDDDNDTFTLAATNIKVGLLNNADLQLVLDAYVDDEQSQGFGNMQVRFKLNLWGNDGGSTAMALMPYIQFPSGSDDLSNDHVEGGLIIPFVTALPAEFSLALMAEIDVIRNAENDGYDLDFVHTASMARQIAGPVAGFVEYIGAAGQGQAYRASIKAGITYELSPDMLLDCGGAVGLNDHAEDVNLFLGFTLRI